jgi:hypothetical protein
VCNKRAFQLLLLLLLRGSPLKIIILQVDVSSGSNWSSAFTAYFSDKKKQQSQSTFVSYPRASIASKKIGRKPPYRDSQLQLKFELLPGRLVVGSYTNYTKTL